MSKLADIKESLKYYKQLGHFVFPLSHVEYLLSLIEEKDKALEFYADESIYDQNEDAFYPEILDDNGTIARTALTSTKEE